VTKHGGVEVSGKAVKTRLIKHRSDYGMGRTWEKFSSLPAKKPQKFETATGKENF